MCRLFAIVALAVAVASPVGFTAPTTAEDEWVPGTRMSASVNSVRKHAIDTAKEGDYGFDRNICMLAGFFLDDRELTFIRKFDKGENYLIVAGTDSNVTSIELDIHDANDNRADGDSGEPPLAIKFRPARSGTYTIKVKLRKTKGKGGGFIALGFFSKNGYDIPINNIRTAMDVVISGGVEVNKLTKGKALFQSGNNQWSLYGAVLEQGEDMTITKVKLGKGERMLIAAGDMSAQDVDVQMLDADDEVLAKDKGKDAFAFLKFTEDEDKYRSIKFKNTKSRAGGPTLVITTVLNLDD